MAILVALVGLVAAGFWEPRGPRQTLPDGTVLEYVGSTFGRDHTIGVGTWWQRLYGFVFPLRAPVPVANRTAFFSWNAGSLGRWYARYPPASPPVMVGSRARFVSVIDEPVLWFRVSAPTSAGMDQAAAHHRWTAALDSHGCRIPCGTDEMGIPTLTYVAPWPGHPEQWLGLAEVRNYNRREGRFRFAFFEENSERPLAEFPAANPRIVRPAEWTAAPLPAQSRQQGMTFALVELSHLQLVRGGVSETARIVPLRNGRRAPFWRLTEAEVQDATGNDWPALLITQNRAFFGGFCRHEPAWKIRAEAAEERPGIDPPDYTWSFPSLPTASEGSRVLCDRTVKDRRCGMTVTAVAGPRAGSSGHREGWGTQAQLEYQAGSGTELQVVLLSVTDEAGRHLLQAQSPQMLPIPIGNRGSLNLPPLGRARHIRVVLGGYRPRHAEFYLRP